MNDYLPKPVPLEALQGKLEKWAGQNLVKESQSGVEKVAAEKEDSDGVTKQSKSANGPTKLSTLDVNVLIQFVGDDKGLIESFLSEYQQSAESAAVKIEDAYNGGQWKQVGELARALKSSSRSVGALALSEICAELESAGKNDDESQDHSAIARFSQSLHAVMESTGQRDS